MSQRGDRKDVLLEAGLALTAELSLSVVLQRIVDLSVKITEARYGALGVLGDDGGLQEFVTSGISAKQRRAIGDPPQGRGVLGLLIREPHALRIANIKDHPAAVGFPPHHPPMESFLGTPVRAMGKVFGNIYLAGKRGASEFSAEDQASLTVLAAQAGVAIANASLYEEASLRGRWLDALRDITNGILGGAAAESQLEGIAEHARALASADVATVVTTSREPNQLTVVAAAGARAERMRGRSMPADNSISGRVMHTGAPLVLEDLSAEQHAHQPIVRLGRHGPAVVVPLHVRGTATGTLMVANLKGGRQFDERTVRFVQAFADQASVAIEYARAQADLRRLELMDDRERIAMELHDGIIQSLFGVGMGLQSTAALAESAESAARIEGAAAELDRVIRDLRNYIFGLRPGILADRQLDQALRVLGQEVAAWSHVAVDVQVDPELTALLSSRSHEIVQLTREALSNVAHHAQATHCSVRMIYRGTKAELTIQDDGVGFKVGSVRTGNGLRNMRERAGAMGGTLRVTSSRSSGSRLRLTLPMEGDGPAGLTG
ncbi:MAG TPA: GAF domain-containing protein [Candidatus Acidoferrales bacterium]|nr:GAF domain-containing protein [Candidatus Acidoferrales bacterium]